MRSGFSLLELLVVLAIMAGTLALAGPRFAGALDALELKGASRDLAAALRKTRARAIAQGKESRLILNLDARSYQHGWLTQTHELPDKVRLTLTTAAREQITESEGAIRFYPDGSATGGEVRLAMDKRSFAIQVNWLTGRVRILE